LRNINKKRIGKIILDVLLYVFLAVCIFSIVVTVLAKRDSDGAANLFGHQMRIVTSDSMAKCEQTDVSDYRIKSLPLRTLLFIELVPEDDAKAEEWYSELEVGDVLTFRYLYATQVTITHRITDIDETEDGYIITLEGDNKNSDSKQMKQVINTAEKNSPNYVIGKVTGQFLPLGFIISLVQTPIGIVLLLIIPCVVIILLEVLKMVKIINSDKKKKLQEESERKDSELEELKRRIAELENQKTEQSSVEENQKDSDSEQS